MHDIKELVNREIPDDPSPYEPGKPIEDLKESWALKMQLSWPATNPIAKSVQQLDLTWLLKDIY